MLGLALPEGAWVQGPESESQPAGEVVLGSTRL